MQKVIFFLYIFYLVNFLFANDLLNINFYRAFNQHELVFFLDLLHKENNLKNDNKLLIYIRLAQEVLKEKDMHIIINSYELQKQEQERYKQSREYNNKQLILSATKELKQVVFIDYTDAFLKTLDKRKVGLVGNKYVILESFNNSEYYNVPAEYSTMQVYNMSIKKPNHQEFSIDFDKRPFVYLVDFNKRVYDHEIEKLSNNELIFLFYTLFPISKLKTLSAWYDFDSKLMKREIKKLYATEKSSRII